MNSCSFHHTENWEFYCEKYQKLKRNVSDARNSKFSDNIAFRTVYKVLTSKLHRNVVCNTKKITKLQNLDCIRLFPNISYKNIV